MKTNISIFFILIFSNVFAQNQSIEEVYSKFCENLTIENIDKPYNIVKESNGFNFSKMLSVDNNLYKQTIVKSYYQENSLVKIQVIDTSERNCNIDLDIIYESDKLYIGTIFLWFKSRKNGIFHQGFFINDRINNEFLLIDIPTFFPFIKISEKHYGKKGEVDICNIESLIYSTKRISILNEKLFIKNSIYFKKSKYIFCSSLYHGVNQLIEEYYIVNDSNFLEYYLNKTSIKKLCNIFDLKLDNYYYLKISKDLTCHKKYIQDRPTWFLPLPNYE